MCAGTALVAGGGGFLGSRLCESLLDEGREVVCVDNFSSGQQHNVSHLLEHPKFSLIETDIREDQDLPAAEQIYHLASRASPADFTRYPVQIALTNTEGTRHLLDHAVEHNARMVFASTSEVYGDPEVHPQPESYTGNVNIRGPRGCYDESKRFGETLTVAYSRKFDLDVRTARVFNTYGPRMRSNDGRVVPSFVTQALAGHDLTIYGDGSQTRSFCYVEDMVDGFKKIMNTEGIEGEVINLGRQNETTIKRLAELIIKFSDSESAITYNPLPEDDPQRRCPDTTRAQQLLDWNTTTSIQEGLTETIEFFRENPGTES